MAIRAVSDRHRAAIFATWIEKQFPPRKHSRVADVAGGTGELSLWLARIGYEPMVYDRRKGKRLKGVSRVRCDVADLRFAPGQHDVVVGMHPDIATWHVIRLAFEARCPFAVVPCCAVCPEHKKRPAGQTWTSWLGSEAYKFGFRTWWGTLDMRGMNKVLKGWLW